ncbi:queuosine precursor transporter [Novosphingobium sp. FKTRR1]|uniref:queuosine precursor transporter n=1 Tax=Novosphingobium sp. FKTRR1 TaxID=2879118 RepID=UPI001CF017D0|nr:queuosine precursor transporter [Novosphingobium sp. FKTRR1]
MTQTPPASVSIPRSLFVFAPLYGGLVVLAGVLGTKIADLGHWPVLGDMAVESGIFAFLLLVVLASTVTELHGEQVARRLVRYGFIPLILSMILLKLVIEVVPPAPIWAHQAEFALILGQGARMQFAGLISYGTSQILNVYVFARLAGAGVGNGVGSGLIVRAWLASMLSQVVDTAIFITISFWGVAGADGTALPIGQMMASQVIAKLALSTVMVPVLIWLAVRLGRRLDATG